MAKNEASLIGLRHYKDTEPFTYEPVIWECRGLVVHRVPGRRGKYRVTHGASGMSVTSRVYYSKEAALLALGRLTATLTWIIDVSDSKEHGDAASAESARPGAAFGR